MTNKLTPESPVQALMRRGGRRGPREISVEDYDTPSGRLRIATVQSGISQRKFADMLGISLSSLGMCISGKSSVSKPLALAVELVHGFEADWILNGRVFRSKSVAKFPVIAILADSKLVLHSGDSLTVEGTLTVTECVNPDGPLPEEHQDNQ
jgi:hypothetical protein